MEIVAVISEGYHVVAPLPTFQWRQLPDNWREVHEFTMEEKCVSSREMWIASIHGTLSFAPVIPVIFTPRRRAHVESNN
jgi:hypothetical protein